MQQPKTNEQVLAESTAAAQRAAESIGGTFEQGVGFKPNVPASQQTTESTGTNEPTASPYFPRYTPQEKQASDYVSSFQAPKTEEVIAAEKQKTAQAEIDALNSHYNSLLEDQRVVNEGRSRGTNAISTLTGLAGSTEANNASNNTTTLNQRDNQKIQNERAVAITGVLSKIRSEAATEARNSRLDARQSAEDILARRKTTQEESVKNLQTLAGSGVTIEGLKKSDPSSYKHLADSVGGEEILKAQFILNRPRNDVVGVPVRVGNHYVQMYKNPLTGAITAENIQLPFELPTEYTSFTKMGDNLVAMPNNWDGDVSKLKTVIGKPSTEEALRMRGVQLDNQKKEKELREMDPSTNPTVSPYFDALSNASLGLPENQRKENLKRLNTYIASGNEKAAKELIIRSAFQGQSGTQREDTIKRQSAIDSLTDIKEALNEYVAQSGDTGILSGTLQSAAQKIGTAGDPELARIGTKITAALQIYRNSITGAAWGTQETEEYNKIFPSWKNTNKLNGAVIDSMLESLNLFQESTLGAYIGTDAYQQVFKGGTTGETAGPSKTLTKDGQSFDASDLSPEEFQQALADGFIEE